MGRFLIPFMWSHLWRLLILHSSITKPHLNPLFLNHTSFSKFKRVGRFGNFGDSFSAFVSSFVCLFLRVLEWKAAVRDKCVERFNYFRRAWKTKCTLHLKVSRSSWLRAMVKITPKKREQLASVPRNAAGTRAAVMRVPNPSIPAVLFLDLFPYSRVAAKTAFILELATAILCSGLMEKMWYACWKWRSVRRQIKTEG